jgi:glycosyltransferase involved in cell wall biosynthesis
MRILHVADFVSEKTGYQDFLLPKFHARHGHEVHIVTSCWNPPAPNYSASLEPVLGPRVMEPGTYVAQGVTIHRLPVRWEFRNRVMLAGLRRACHEIEPEAVFVHDTMTPTALRMAGLADSLGVPIYFDNHSIFSVQNRSVPSRIGYGAFRQVMRHYMAPRATGFYGVANECVDFLVMAQGVPIDKVDLLPLGVDTDLFHEDLEGGQAWRRSHGIALDAFVVTQTGKLDPAKDPLTLARAVAELPRRDRELHLVFVGAGPAPYVQSLVEEIEGRSPHRVSVLPPVEVGKLAAVFSGSDVVCYPGGTSMSSLEAAACGRIVVMNDEAVSEWRAQKGIGLTFREGDATSLARRLDEIRGLQKEEMVGIGRRACQAATQEFSYEGISRRLEDRMASDRAARG